MDSQQNQFFWGAATSAHQVEGGTKNDWSEWEKSPERIADLKKRGLNPEEFISGRASDHYHRFREDFDIAKSLGHNAHRFSIEWSRIEPREGEFDEKEIEHYREVIRALRERGMEPFVTLWHFTNPIWFSERGGWASKKAPMYFARYCEKMAVELKEVQFWMTLNEPDNVYAGLSYYAGIWPPQRNSLLSYLSIVKNFIRGHKEAYRRMHLISPGIHIGVAHNQRYVVRSKHSIKNLLISVIDYWRNKYFLQRIASHLDFIGLNYYTTYRLRNDYSLLPRQEQSEFEEWEIYPKGIYYLLRRLAHYKKSIYITENGIADAHDQNRAQFINNHLSWVAKAIQEGVDVRGYFYWSLLDNFEWDKGFWPRFGLVEVDHKTLERKIRPSAWTYKEIIEKSDFLENPPC